MIWTGEQIVASIAGVDFTTDMIELVDLVVAGEVCQVGVGLPKDEQVRVRTVQKVNLVDCVVDVEWGYRVSGGQIEYSNRVKTVGLENCQRGVLTEGHSFGERGNRGVGTEVALDQRHGGSIVNV